MSFTYLVINSTYCLYQCGGGPASEASLLPEASQVVAEGDGLRVYNITV